MEAQSSRVDVFVRCVDPDSPVVAMHVAAVSLREAGGELRPLAVVQPTVRSADLTRRTKVAGSIAPPASYDALVVELDGAWQRLDKIRILMGADIGASTKALIAKSVRSRAESMLDQSLEKEKDKHLFLDGTDAIVEALRDGTIECRVYTKDKFHAKAYITHGRSEVIGSRSLVGSSNFTRPPTK